MAALAPAATAREYPGLSNTENGAMSCDVVFLAHAPSIVSLFSLLSREKRPLRRWKASPWMYLGWPITFLMTLWDMFVAPLLFGPYSLYGRRFQYKEATCEQWLTRAFAYQFMFKRLRPRIARGIEAAVRKADEAGVKVFGLGALTKAEWINGGGQDVLKALEPLNLSLVHGNTLTAAVVIENIKAASESITSGSSVFLTGPTSKIGRALALKLALEGFEVVCCTTSDERFASLQQELASLQQQEPHDSKANLGTLLRARRVQEGSRYMLWAVGKYDTSVRIHIRQRSSAVVFSVPCPLEGYRPDVSRTNGGILRMDSSSCTPRGQHFHLPFDQVYACQAASLVHYLKGWTHHETGQIDINRIDIVLQAAKECGFSVPSAPSGGGSAAVADV
ncbi:unnamed protein product [Ectocarpus sp. 12 AP-2014]